ncbi:MAG: transposase [Chloroflexota bacterium]|nr:transposase [Chloroflexota bacterium]
MLSNIAVLTRLGLFVETVTHFLKAVRQEAPDFFSGLDAGYARRYLDREGYFSDAKREQARRRLPVVAQDAYALVKLSAAAVPVNSLAAFGLLKRLVDEQCEIVEPAEDDREDGGPGDGEGGVGAGGPKVQLREPKTIASDSLQSPHDPDATYGHKGKGYEVQIAETCGADNPYQLITGVAVNGAHESDQKALLPMVDQLKASQLRPEELLADTGYGSGANIVECIERGVELLAPVQDPDAPDRPEPFAMPVAQAAAVPAAPESQPAGNEVREDEAGAADRAVEAPGDAQASPPAQPGASCGPTPTAIEAGRRLGLADFWFSWTLNAVNACPGREAPASQHLTGDQLIARFSAGACGSCPLACACPTRGLASGERLLRASLATIATEIRQQEQQQPEFKELYRVRSGVESTNSEIKGRHGLDDLRVRGKQRVSLAARLKALALNAKRAALYHVAELAAATATPCPCPG